MDALARASTAATTASFSINGVSFPSVSVSIIKLRGSTRNVCFSGKRRELKVFAEKEEPKLDKWDLMELKFGRLLGEDPKLTLAKIMGKKANPDASYLEIEKSFYKNKGKIVEVKEVPFDVSKDRKSSNSSDGLDLVRPVPKKGIKFKSEDKQMSPEMRRPSPSNAKPVDNTNKGRVPNVILRKPTVFSEDDTEDKPSKFNMKPNLSLKMKSQPMKEKFSDMTLLRKPEPMSMDEKHDYYKGNAEVDSGEDSIQWEKGKEVGEHTIGDFTLIKKPELNAVEKKVGRKQEKLDDVETEAILLDSEQDDKKLSIETKTIYEEPSKLRNGVILKKPGTEAQSMKGVQHIVDSHMSATEQNAGIDGPFNSNLGESNAYFSIKAELQGKPKRLDHYLNGASNYSRGEVFLPNSEDYEYTLSVSPLEATDWTRAEDLRRTGERVEVELISASTRGFVVSFGSLIGFLPYRNLSAKWKFLAFESWLRQKGVDPTTYKQNLGVIGSNDVKKKTSSADPKLSSENDQTFEGEISPEIKLEDLLQIYDAEKLKFLSSFVGQKIKVFVVMADKKSRKLIFSLRLREKEDLLEKKRILMAKLRVGDVVKCCIKKITYFGIFVEVEGVPALVHQTEVSWDAAMDPASFFKNGQVVEAKVHQLDFALERIFLSLKEITPDPLAEALESVIRDHDDLDGRLQAAQAETEWADVELLIKELEKIDGVQSVSKGRFFLSPGLTPTFQVYMASMFENQYKLLARSGNRVQEVIVQASLSKEEMKSTILSCTSRVE